MARNAEGAKYRPVRTRLVANHEAQARVVAFSVRTSPTYVPVRRPLRSTVSRPTPRLARTFCPRGAGRRVNGPRHEAGEGHGPFGRIRAKQMSEGRPFLHRGGGADDHIVDVVRRHVLLHLIDQDISVFIFGEVAVVLG